MSARTLYDQDGIRIQQMAGPAVEVYFDWDLLPPINLAEEYYIVELIPDKKTIPVEFAAPNSSGPLHFYLREGVNYQFCLVSVPHPHAIFESHISPSPWCELVPQHENLQKLIWGDLDLESERAEADQRLNIYADGRLLGSVGVNDEPEYVIHGRPSTIDVWLNESAQLFTLTTDLRLRDVKRNLWFRVEGEAPRLFFSTNINPMVGGRRVLAEIPVFPGMWRHWLTLFQQRFPEKDPSFISGHYTFFEDGNPVLETRQFGYCARVQSDVISKIQTEEWNLSDSLPVESYRLALQLTSAHRELFRFTLIDKTVNPIPGSGLVAFTTDEIEQAEQALFHANEHVFWDQSYIELVLFFKVKGHDWQEFQREVSHSTKWEYQPKDHQSVCSVAFSIRDMDQIDDSFLVLMSGVEKPIRALDRVALKPYNSDQIFACWDIDEQAAREKLHLEWQVGTEKIDFFLKIHEEYLGSRCHRADLDSQIFDIFGVNQNQYLRVEPNKCYSAEIVARNQHKELALTPVSSSIVTPRKVYSSIHIGSDWRRVANERYHPSQREVRHDEGKDSHNFAKALIHLHMHSPNLFRIDPFRDRYLRDSVWPIQLPSGAEVHNPPGEWVYKNCMDAWLPLIRALRKLDREDVDYQISIDISPPVTYMISSPRFKDYMSRYLKRVQAYVMGRIALMKSRRDSPELIWAAERYLADLGAIDLFYNHELRKDIIGAFQELEAKGHLEIITCTATHGMAAELQSIPDALKTQITLATRNHHRLFGNRSTGIWLAENSYFPGVEKLIETEGLHYFFVESESILYGSSQPVEEEYNPVIIPGSGTVAFGRSRLGRTQVWDAELGYAGHPDFREYHFRHLGLPIKRITSKTSTDKLPYNPDRAEEVARSMAWDFHHKLSTRGVELSQRDFKSIPLITCAYDAELFGHHWAEGPLFLEELLRTMFSKSDSLGLTTPSHYLAECPLLPDITPNPSTWGHEAVHVKWTDPKVAWTFIEFEKADAILAEYLGYAAGGKLSSFQIKAVEQMAAEFIRSQSSDLTFVIMADAFEEDMRREILKYLNHFYRLKHLIDNNMEDEDWLRFRRYENDMFPEIPDYYRLQPN